MNEKTGIITERLKDLWQARHWTTKLVWTAGVAVFTLALLFVLIYPPIFHAIEGLTIVEGEVIAQGVINTSIGVDFMTNISCKTMDDCPFIGGMSSCSNSGYCLGHGAREEINGDSFSVRGWDGTISNVVDLGLKMGERVKLAVDRSGRVVERGGLLWDSQSRYLRGLFVVPLFVDVLEDISHASEAGYALIILPFAFFGWFCVGFLIVWDNLLVRFLNAFIVLYLVLMLCFNLVYSVYMLYGTWELPTPFTLLQLAAIFVPAPLAVVLIILNVTYLVKWVVKERKKS